LGRSSWIQMLKACAKDYADLVADAQEPKLMALEVRCCS
jgi:hypothetical protein